VAEHAPPHAKALLDTLTSSTSLPALVANLEPQALKRLVDDVGLADAGPLIEYASTTQISHLVDESIWQSSHASIPETIDAAALLAWFDLWLDVGEAFAAAKLIDLGLDFCTMAFARLVVVDGEATRVGDEFSLMIGGHGVGARYADEWDSLSAVVLALWDEDPDFLEALFDRLSFRHSMLGIAGELDAASVLEADAGYARTSEKTRQGYVAGADAAAFLSEIQLANLELLVAEQAYDLATKRFFRELDAGAQDGKHKPEETTPRRDAPADTVDADLDALQRELEHYEHRRGKDTRLLTGPDLPEEQILIRRVLADLQARPSVLEARTRELAYLSNLVITGCRMDSQEIPENTAANLIMATCNLAAGFVAWQAEGETDPTAERFSEMLLAEPGLIRLFRIGWNLLGRIPLQVARSLNRLLLEESSPTRAALRPWLRDEVDSLLKSPGLLASIETGDFDDARETVAILSIVLDETAVEVLAQLVDSVPRLCGRLAPVHTGKEGYNWRYLSSIQDFRTVDQLLNSLQEHTHV
jgi:hypothetical protein